MSSLTFASVGCSSAGGDATAPTPAAPSNGDGNVTESAPTPSNEDGGTLSPPTGKGFLILIGNGRSVRCMPDASKGAFTVPDEYVRAVTDYPRTDDAGPYLSFGALASSRQQVRAGDYDVLISHERDFGRRLALH